MVHNQRLHLGLFRDEIPRRRYVILPYRFLLVKSGSVVHTDTFTVIRIPTQRVLRGGLEGVQRAIAHKWNLLR